MIISHAGHEPLDGIPGYESCQMQSGVRCIQHVVMLHFHAVHLDPTLDEIVIRTCRKRVVEMVL